MEEVKEKPGGREGGFPLFLSGFFLLGWRRRPSSAAEEEDRHSSPPPSSIAPSDKSCGRERKKERKRAEHSHPSFSKASSAFPSQEPFLSSSFPRAEAPPRFGLMGLGEGEGRGTKVEKREENGRSLSLIQRRRCFRRFRRFRRRRRRRRRGSFVPRRGRRRADAISSN